MKTLHRIMRFHGHNAIQAFKWATGADLMLALAMQMDSIVPGRTMLVPQCRTWYITLAWDGETVSDIAFTTTPHDRTHEEVLLFHRLCLPDTGVTVVRVGLFNKPNP